MVRAKTDELKTNISKIGINLDINITKIVIRIKTDKIKNNNSFDLLRKSLINEEKIFLLNKAKMKL